MRFRLFVCLLAIVAAVSVGVRPVSAFSAKTGDNVVVSVDSVVDGTLFAVGRTVEVRGHIEGDLFCAGQTVLVDAEVDGDVLCAGQTVNIAGNVAGDVRAAGQYVTIAASAEKNLMSFGQAIQVAESAEIGGDAMVGGNTLSINGLIGRDALVMGESVDLNGTVLRNVTADAVRMAVGSDARILGELAYTSQAPATIANSASVSGGVRFSEKPREVPKQAAKRQQLPQYIPNISFGSIVFYIIMGLVVAGLFPTFMRRTAEIVRAAPWKTLGVGFLVLCGVPMALLILLATIIGIPVALFAGMLFASVMVIVRIFATTLVGDLIMKQVFPKAKQTYVWPVIVGVVVCWTVFGMPFIGPWASFAAQLLGLGAFFSALSQQKSK